MLPEGRAAKHIFSRGDVNKHPQTTQQVTPASVNAAPEFADFKGIKALYGFSRATLYRLDADGLITSVSLRRRGSLRGKRLWSCDSIRRFLASQMEGGK
jgi:hypothetical protein